MKLLNIGLLLCLTVAGLAFAAPSAEKPARPGPIHDGVMLVGMDGTFKFDKEKQTFLFVPQKKFSDGTNFIRGGDEIELLPNNLLEAMLKDTKTDAGEQDIRLWGNFTAYKGRNYIFPTFYLPLKAVEKQTNNDTRQQAQTDNTSENKNSLIPADILEKMTPEKVVDIKRVRDMLDSGKDIAIVDRYVTIDRVGDDYILRMDPYGQSVSSLSFTMLKCEAMEMLTASDRIAPYRKRYSVSGIATMYAGENYFLLNRFRRIYSFGNFPR